MSNNVYIGSRYVPIFDGAWSSIKTYESLTIVEYGNNSFTSKRPVPLNIPPTTGDENDPYWALTGNYNGQISNLQRQINDNTSDITALMKKANYVTPEDFGAVGDGVTDDTTALQAAFNDPHTLIGNGTYRISNTITATVEKDICIDGLILCVGAFDGFIIGSHNVPLQGYFIGKKIVIKEIRKVTEDWTNQHTAITFINVWRAEISMLASGWHTGIKLIGDNYGCAWNLIYNPVTHTCKYGLVMEQLNGGWTNQNTIIGGSFGWVHSYAMAHSSASDPCKGLIIVGNANAFYNVAVDGTGSGSTDYAHYIGVESSGAHNRFNYVRFERVGEVKFTGLYDVLEYAYLYENITTITRTYPTSAFITLFNHKEIVSDSTDSAVTIQTVNNSASILKGKNSGGSTVLDLSAIGHLKVFASISAYDGHIKFTQIDDPDAIHGDMPNTSAYFGFNTLNSNPELGLMIGYRLDANRGAQYSFGIFGNIRKRTMTSGTWGAWTAV